MLKAVLNNCWLVGFVCATAIVAPAMACPNDTIRMVIGYSAGGTGGIVGTTIAEPLSRELGKKVVVDYQPGASGGTAARGVAKAAADGCTLLLGQTPEIAINPVVDQKLGYDPTKDFQPVARIAAVPLALVVSKSAPYSTLEALTTAVSAARPAMSFASAGRGTPGYYAGELLRLRTRSPLTHISFDGGGIALQAVVSGQVSLYFPALTTAMEETNKGLINILGVTSSQRSQAVPQIPTLNEAGLAPFNLDIWVGVFAPSGTSNDVVKRINQAINSVLLQQSIRQTLVDKGASISISSASDFAAFVRSEQEHYKNFIGTEFCDQCPW